MEWRYPKYRDTLNETNILARTSYVEWRYYAIIHRGFHGIIGMSLLNPENHFQSISEGGFLILLAGLTDAPGSTEESLNTKNGTGTGPKELCRMHLFKTTDCRFNDPVDGSLIAEDSEASVKIVHTSSQAATVELKFKDGMSVNFSHRGIEDAFINPVTGKDLRVIPGGHWTVFCASPIATTSGDISIPGEKPIRWTDAPGYYEHSYGIHPLPLLGWDFLFAPEPEKGQGIVLQTYRKSRELRYIETFWTEDGEVQYERFVVGEMDLKWEESYKDSIIGVRLPRVRQIKAKKNNLELSITNRIFCQVPLLRPEKLAVRHFFISEQISFTDWTLHRNGKVIAEGEDVPSGGELAHFRFSTGA